MSNESLLFWIVLIVGFLLYIYFNNELSKEGLKIIAKHQKDLDKQGIEHEKNNKSEIEINGKIWMTKNLNTDKYQNGDVVILCQTEEEWQDALEKKNPVSCYYNFDETLADYFGRLYNWYAVNDSRGLAPQGWKIPNYKVFKELIDESEKTSDFRSRLGWENKKGHLSRNGYGLSVVPSGVKNDECDLVLVDGIMDEIELEEIEAANGFIGQRFLAGFWSSDEESTYEAKATIITNVSRHLLMEKSDGLSVRCIKEHAYANLEKSSERFDTNPDEYKEKYIKLLEAEVERLKNEIK